MIDMISIRFWWDIPPGDVLFCLYRRFLRGLRRDVADQDA